MNAPPELTRRLTQKVVTLDNFANVFNDDPIGTIKQYVETKEIGMELSEISKLLYDLSDIDPKALLTFFLNDSQTIYYRFYHFFKQFKLDFVTITEFLGNVMKRIALPIEVSCLRMFFLSMASVFKESNPYYSWNVYHIAASMVACIWHSIVRNTISFSDYLAALQNTKVPNDVKVMNYKVICTNPCNIQGNLFNISQNSETQVTLRDTNQFNKKASNVYSVENDNMSIYKKEENKAQHTFSLEGVYAKFEYSDKNIPILTIKRTDGSPLYDKKVELLLCPLGKNDDEIDKIISFTNSVNIASLIIVLKHLIDEFSNKENNPDLPTLN